ncbi:MAG TPA: hypothetical protein VGE45_08270 [Chloroflexia bacterium]|jgi:hypothetical protein
MQQLSKDASEFFEMLQKLIARGTYSNGDIIGDGIVRAHRVFEELGWEWHDRETRATPIVEELKRHRLVSNVQLLSGGNYRMGL